MKISFIPVDAKYNVFMKPGPASKFLPEWFRKLKKENTSLGPKDGLTIKACPPVLDYNLSGYVIPLWMDMSIDTRDKCWFEWPNKDYNLIHYHAGRQIEGSPLREELHESDSVFKLTCPWRIKTPPGYSCLFFSPFYHRGPIEILPGIVDTDGTHGVNFPFIVHQKKDFVIMKEGTPVIQILPFKRESWTHTMEEPDPEVQLKETWSLSRRFKDNYKKLWHQKKEFR